MTEEKRYSIGELEHMLPVLAVIVLFIVIGVVMHFKKKKK